jgi:hypothetical protein
VDYLGKLNGSISSTGRGALGGYEASAGLVDRSGIRYKRAELVLHPLDIDAGEVHLDILSHAAGEAAYLFICAFDR